MGLVINSKTPQQISIGGKEVQSLAISGEIVWQYVVPDYFYIQNEYAGANTITLTKTGSPTDISLDYSTDNGETWTTWSSANGNLSVGLAQGEKVLLKGTNDKISTSSSAYFSFSGTQNHSIGGNMVALYDSTCLSDTVPTHCFNRLFLNDTTLISASNAKITATNFNHLACSNTFKGCTALVSSLEFTANSVGENSFDSMFDGATSLNNVSNIHLDSTSLTVGTCKVMFRGTAITTAPEIKATTIYGNSSNYNNGSMAFMFHNCSNLTSIKIHFTDWKDGNGTYNWVDSVAALGVFYKPSALSISTNSNSGVPTGWTVESYDADYLYIQNEYAGDNTLTLTTTSSGTPTSGTYSTSVQYSKDKSTWTTINLTAGGTNSIQMSEGEKVYFRNNSGYFNTRDDSNNKYCTSFSCSQNHSTGGCVNSLLDYNNMTTLTLTDGCFCELFFEDDTLIDASDIVMPTQDLPLNACRAMFNNCDILVYPPESIPSSQLGKNSCFSMFGYSPSLISVPTISATTVGYAACDSMFRQCASLQVTKVLPATNISNYCYANMYRNSGITTIVNNMLPATTLAPNCYANMFNSATGLTSIPENLLPATTLANTCYYGLFANCTNITSIPTNLLPATTLVNYCYELLFKGCSNLNDVTIHITNWNTGNTSNWLQDVAATGDLYSLGGATLPTGPDGIPVNWTVHTSL